MNKAVLSVALNDVSGNAVPEARVELQGAESGTRLTFDARLRAFVSEPVEPGEYALKVRAEGYAAQDVALRVPPHGMSTSLSLGREGEPYYVQGGRRVYFEAEGDQPLAEARALDTTDLLPLGKGRFLERQISVIVETGVTREQLEAAIRPFRLHVSSQYAFDPRIFRVESEEDLSAAELGALPERLRALPEIRVAQSIVSGLDPASVVMPADPLFPLQFYETVVRLPEAWDLLKSKHADLTFGSADLIVAVSDSGIDTVAVHPEFAGMVTGSTLHGVIANKLLFTFDFRGPLSGAPQPAPADVHGTAVAGIISAAANGVGIVGVAANTRLTVYRRRTPTGAIQSADAYLFYAGLDPRWRRTVNYSPTEPFPILFGTGANAVPGAHILNCSHELTGGVTPELTASLQAMTLFGRNRRGTLIFAAANNNDQDLRADALWAEDTNVMRVGATTLDHREREVRANYSNFSTAMDRVLDFSAPSESQNVFPRAIEDIPRIMPLVTTSFPGAAVTQQQGTLLKRISITNNPAQGTDTITASLADLLGLPPGGTQLIIRDKTNLHAERHDVSGIVNGTVTLQRTLAFSYTAANTELIFLSPPREYTFDFGGTSAACPVAAGIAALMLSHRPKLTWLEVRELMRSTAVPVDIRGRGFGPAHRYRWIDPAQADLIDGNGLLEIVGGSKTITAGPIRRGDRFLTLSDTNGIAPRQALLIGAETRLTVALPQPLNDRRIDVESAADFGLGDVIFIGRDQETMLIREAHATDTVVWVQSTDGLAPNADISIDIEPATVTSLQRLSAAGLPPNSFTGDAETGLNLSSPLMSDHARLQTVRLALREGPFTITGKAGNTLTVDPPLVVSHPAGTLVEKQDTEIKAVVRVLSSTRVEIDPLHSNHPLNASGVEHVRVGRVAAYSLGIGYGRLDAKEAVLAAKNYSHDTRDLVVRNFLADDGVNNTGTQEVHSPDIWVRNRTPDTDATLNYADAGPHEVPEITIDPAIHIGTGRNDLEVSGTCTSAAEVTFTIEITQLATDRFTFRKDDGAPSGAVAITGAAQPLSDGVSIKFAATTGHSLGDKWIVRARQIGSRFLHVRVRNRGNQPFFESSPFSPTGAPQNVAEARILLCVTDGLPVCRYASVAAAAGLNDMRAVTAYTGARDPALYTVEITALAGAGDTFQWHRDGTLGGTVTLGAAALEHPLNDDVRVRFGSHTGHTLGDRWNIFARPQDAFLNIDHYTPADTPAGFNPSSGGLGTFSFGGLPISGLDAGASHILVSGWAEPTRFPTNNPNLPRPTLPRRMFLLGEAVPHDGEMDGASAKGNNNFSFREIVFAKARFSMNDSADALPTELEVPVTGTQVTTELRVEVRCTAGTFAAEKVQLKLTGRKGAAAPPEIRTFRFAGSSWGWNTVAPSWGTVAPPNEARRPDGSLHPAAGEQFDIAFDCELKIDMSFSDIEIEAQIVSGFRDLAVFTAKHSIAVFAQAPMPTGTGAAQAASLPKPSSHVFAEMGSIVPQTAAQAFGPVSGSLTTRYRTTSLFRSATDVRAFAVADGLVAIQRDPTNNDTVNLILRPLDQPLAGFTAIKYFIYRGLKLGDFLKGASGADAKLIRPEAGSSPLISFVWTNFVRFNPGATDMPAAVFGYDPDTQTGTDSLDDLFLQSGSPLQRPLIPERMELGSFHAGGGNADFGFEVVLEDGDFAHDLEYARKASNEIDITAMPNGTPEEKLARRIKQEEILNYLDPAAFYGLHMHDGGEVFTPTPAQPLTGDGIFQEIVSKFTTKHSLYLDVRSENGASLNFYGNYGVAGNQVRVAAGLVESAVPVAQPYATHGWPIVIADQSTGVNNPDSMNGFLVELARNDNEEPVVYVDHGIVGMSMTDGSFLRGSDLHTGNAFTEAMRFGVPATGPTPARQGVAWVIRLFYGRLKFPPPPVPVPVPPTVLKTLKYTDNVFGPIDRVPKWAGTAGIKWITTQDNRYVDADDVQGLNWRQMMRCGMAEQTGATPRVLLYAAATARDTEQQVEFAPIRSITSGASNNPSFFQEAGLFGVYQLEQDQITDAATNVRTLRLRQRPQDGYSPMSAMLIGLTKVEFDALLARGVSISQHFRSLLLEQTHSGIDPNGVAFTRHRVGVQGLNKFTAVHETDFPPDEIQVYSVDGQLFASRLFAEAEPLPTSYARNFEEAMGVRVWPQRERRIAFVTVGTRTITIASYDWRKEVMPGLTLKIDKSLSQNGQYTVESITYNGTDTAIVLAGGTLNATAPVGSAYSPARPVEDVIIDWDQDGAIAGIPRTRQLVDTFATDVAGIANNAGARAALLARINDAAPRLLRRARERAAANRLHAEDAERTLYWARQRMLVALKSHAYTLSSVTARNELVRLFERLTRGYNLDFAGAPGGVTRRILLTGFDPFQLDLDITQSNPSAATALALHGQTITSSGKTAYCEAAIFPVRYRDFDAGVVEALVNPRLAGTGRVDLIITISQNGGDPFFDVERLAGRRRLGFPDNEHVTFGPRQLGTNATHPAFHETTLPVAQFVAGPFLTPPDDDQRVFFDQSYESTGGAFQRGSDPDALPGANANTPSYPFNTITGEAVEGSGGSYLSNEVFYRVAQSRVTASSTTLTGHVHIPSPSNASMDIAAVIGEVENMIERYLDSLP